jgi:branched-chain amino acid transport system ATP-binding protein
MNTILRTEGLSKRYGLFQALKDMSFEVARNQTYAIIGPNGAGKSTLFKLMTGEVPQDSGRVWLNGRDISGASADERVPLGLGRTFQIVRVFGEFTLMENLILAIETRNRLRRLGRDLWLRPDAAVIDEAYQRLHHLGIARHYTTEAHHLSLGDRKRLELAMTLAMEPMVLMLDEPTAGMSPAERVAIIDLIQRTKEELGLTILLTEHDMDFVFRLSQVVMVMNHGQKIMDGSPEEVAASPIVREIYLGKELVHA